jgi:hypothetical protein
MGDSHSCRPWGEDDGTDHAVGVWRTGRWREAANGQGRKAERGQDNDALYDEVRESAGIGHEGPADQVRGVSSVLVSPTGEILVVCEPEAETGEGSGGLPSRAKASGRMLSFPYARRIQGRPSRLALKAQHQVTSATLLTHR